MRKSHLWGMCLSFLSVFVGLHYVGDTLFLLREIPVYIVAAAAAVVPLLVPTATWKEIERMCSQAIKLKLNLFSRPAGASVLNSPLLS